MKKLILLVSIIITACSIVKPIPIETGTTVHVVDSTAVHWIDSVRIHEATRYKDFSWIGDTLKLNGNRSRAWAVADTLKGAIIGEIEEDKVEEKTRIVYRDRIQYKDSLVYKEVPVPVEVEKEVKYVPWYHKFLSGIGLISILMLLVFVGFKILKLKGEGFLSVFKKLKIK